MKRFITGALALITGLTMAFSPTTVFATSQQPSERPIAVYVHGERVTFPDQQPVIIDGNTLVGVRGVFDTLGFEIEWSGATATTPATVTMTRHTDEQEENGYEDVVIITIGSRHLEVNGQKHPYALNIPAQLIGGRTMLPLRAPLEAVGYELEWIGTTRTILITRPTPTNDTPQNNHTTGVLTQSEMERRVFELINEERQAEGLHPLIWHDGIAAAARAHAQDLHDTNRLSHTGSDGSTPAQRLQRQGIIGVRTAPQVRPEGVTFISTSGENVGGTPGVRTTPERSVANMMASTDHRANALTEMWTHAGVGFYNGKLVIKFIAAH